MTFMFTDQTAPDAQGADNPDACYLALAARDVRFDGLFFTGVTSTGIYCRPICRVRTPKRSNCLFFNGAAQAELAGFRPCLRCRPELAPETRPWSTHDASTVLLSQAVMLLRQPDTPWAAQTAGAPSVAALANRLGVSDRHVRRLFQAGLGVSPLQYLQTQRLLTAKQLLTDTSLPMSEVARQSGFGSVRRFNDSLKAHYALTPGAIRRTHTAPFTQTHIRLTLAYRPPCDIHALLSYLHQRTLPGVESIDLDHLSITRTLRMAAPDSSAQPHTGWLRVVFDSTQPKVYLEVSEGLSRNLPALIRLVRHWLDLDAEPLAVARTLGKDLPAAAGVRLPGCLDGFELALRAVLGQQITVQAANRLMARLTATLGSPVETPWPSLDKLVPTPSQVLQTTDEVLGRMGIIGQRQRALKALAHAVLHEGLVLDPAANPQRTEAALLALPGFGPWTSSYVVMRALHWPNAFPAQDVALQKALGTRLHAQAAKATEDCANAWQPWRSYAAMCLWQGHSPVDQVNNQ
jgi:AraC family transcriptional regulator of adaptative response / DNA-3-methyladenine glycosylase II